jgi:hypothetical protein
MVNFTNLQDYNRNINTKVSSIQNYLHNGSKKSDEDVINPSKLENFDQGHNLQISNLKSKI